MNSGAFTRGAIATKVRAKSGRLIKKTDYENICRMKTKAEVLEYLKALPGYFSKESVGFTSLGEALRSSLAGEILSLYKFSGGEVRAFLRLYIVRHEIGLLKDLLRYVLNPRLKGESFAAANLFPGRLSFDTAAAGGVKTFSDLLEFTKGTVYYKILAGARDKELFWIETRLDIFFFTYLWALINSKLGGEDKKAALEIFGKRIDALNIIWIYRAKVNYDMPGESIGEVLIPINYGLRPELVKKMISAGGEGELLKIIAQTPCAAIFKEGAGGVSAAAGEYMLKVLSAAARGYPRSLAPMLYYIGRKEQENKNIITAAEGIRYALPPEEILGMLTLGRAPR